MRAQPQETAYNPEDSPEQRKKDSLLERRCNGADAGLERLLELFPKKKEFIIKNKRELIQWGLKTLFSQGGKKKIAYAAMQNRMEILERTEALYKKLGITLTTAAPDLSPEELQ